jgi:uncharacterized protein
MSNVSTEIWSDLDCRLIVDAQGSIKKVINIDAVKVSIDNILRTAKGTRVMLRDFGCDLRSMLFENIDGSLTKLITDEIKRAINTWDNRVIVNSIGYKADPDNNSVSISLKFSIRGFDEIFSMVSTL